MRISIWQQWASNHSGGFTVVGTFKSPEQASVAAGEMRRLLQGLADWYSDPANLAALEEGLEWNEVPFAPIEREYQARFNIDAKDWTWREDGIDWITDTENIDRALRILENRVFVSNPDDTWQGAEPVCTLLKLLGAEQVVSADSDFSWIGINLAFTVPDETSAETVVEVFNACFSTGKSEVLGDLRDIAFDEGSARREGIRVFIEHARTNYYLFEDLSDITARLEKHGFREVVCSLEEISYE